ncbi:uncharacterized protein LOC105208750 [Zeugodacus cucurbitae]|uniref:uncharacterized protein LOC105208750 n=1 Tax=Zeugodacus cucurbitae TaxID=28588 RepID=UPI0023D95272|nr:uncharacterized protein LOC105208750 [Zeugodacus cucurbitae]
MKFVYVLAFVALAYAVSVAAVCDPYGSGEPDCTTLNEGAITRNFWDPTRYWQCQNGAATPVRCDDGHGFLTSAGKCVLWSEWEWVAPCPQESA